MDALRKEETYTVEDIYALPDVQRAERIDGKIYGMDFHNITKMRKPRNIIQKQAGH